MSFGLPSIKTKPGVPEKFGVYENTFGVPDLFTNGLVSSRSNADPTHPVARSELNYRQNVDKMNMSILRNTQGLHAPMRISMEMKFAKKIGRLPFLPSSNVMLESLTGRDLEIGPEDIFNTSEFLEVSGQPHAVLERSLGLL